MLDSFVIRVRAEEERGLKKWGGVDKTPKDLLIAATEELGEVAHAINHAEGCEAVQQEVIEVVGILSRLYAMESGLE